MATLRQYANSSVIAQIVDIAEVDLNEKLISRAESMIDAYIADFYQGGLAKCFNSILTFNSNQTTFVDTTLTLLTGVSTPANYYSHNVIELLEGNQNGLLIPVISSVNNVLTLDTVTGLTGQLACRIYQLGKFPMCQDCTNYKSIPREVIEAVAYQCEFLIKEGKKLNKRQKAQEGIGSNYSYVLADPKDTYIGIENRISPIARDLLQPYIAQTI